MIFINKGEDYRTHEIISKEEYEQMYGPRPPRPYKESGDRLREIRVNRRVTMKTMAMRLSKALGRPFSVTDVSAMECGETTMMGAASLWLKCAEAVGALP